MDHFFQKKSGWKDYLMLKSVNPVVRILTLTDFLVLSGFGLFGPIFAIFVSDSIRGGSVEVVGIAEALYLLTKGLLQIPIASVIDKIKGERDDFWALFIGTLVYSFIPIMYILIRTPMQLYLVQIVYGAASALTLPSWYALFTRHVDKNHEGIEWGVYRTFTDFGGAVSASIGGLLAYRYGFARLFILVSIISIIGTIFLAGVYNKLRRGRVTGK